MRLMLYSHDGLGLGHTRRHLAVATWVGELAPDTAVLVASGADDVSRLGLPAHVEVLKLPGLRKVANDQYAPRRLPIPASEVRALRSALLLAAVNAFRPSLVLVDKHPFGAKGEFRAALEALRDFGGRAVLGLRDILDDRETVLAEWAPHNLQRAMEEYYDRILVYGHRAVFDPVTEYQFPAALARRTHFCGYVVNREEPEVRNDARWAALTAPERARPLVLATAGGGEDGFAVLETFVRAAAGARWQGAVVAGPMTPEPAYHALQRLAAGAGVALYAFVPSLSSLFRSVDALVCMGGYNTLAEAVSQGVPTVCVPRTAPRSEQLIRARAFERLGLVKTVLPPQLDAETLRETVDAVLGSSREALLAKAQASLTFDGAQQAARQLFALAAAKNEASLAP